MNHAHPLIQLLNIADNSITVGELKAAANAMFPSPEAWQDNPAPKGMMAAKALPKPKAKASKPRTEKGPGAEVEAALERIMKLLGDHSGMRAEQIRRHTEYPVGLIGRALRFGVNSGKLRREGEKRATTYYLA